MRNMILDSSIKAHMKLQSIKKAVTAPLLRADGEAPNKIPVIMGVILSLIIIGAVAAFMATKWTEMQGSINTINSEAAKFAK